MKGLVVKVNSGTYLVRTCEEYPPIECRIKGNMRTQKIRSTNPVVAGDFVEVDDEHWITHIYERKNYIIRKATNLSKQTHILAANIDLAALIITINHPVTSTIFIDRFLATAEAYNIPATLIFNKIDLLSASEIVVLNDLCALYNRIGYLTLQIAATQDKSWTEALKAHFSKKTILLSGNSGVGKSTIINALSGTAIAKTHSISQAHNKGMHTTTFSQMYSIGDFQIIDTPGIKGFGLFDMKKEEISHYFKDIFSFAGHCHFANCTHTHEAECAVIEAVKAGEIALSRYDSYLNMLADDTKYR